MSDSTDPTVPRARVGLPVPSEPLSEADELALHAYLDGELPDAERAAFEARLRDEPALRAEHTALRKDLAVLRSADVAPIPENSPPEPDPSVFVADSRSKTDLMPRRGQLGSAAFKNFKTRLSGAAPSEIPVAAALPPPRLRRFFTVGLALFVILMGLGLLGKILKLASRENEATSVAWRAVSGGTWKLQRGGKILEGARERLRPGDRIHTDAQHPVELSGPHGLKLRLGGPETAPANTAAATGPGPVHSQFKPCVLRLEPDGRIFLESGCARLESPNPTAISTPDGEIQLKAAGALEIEVK